MKIAVAYKDGEVFQHFGKTEAFKIYEVEDGKVVSAEVMEPNGAGHSALAGFLAVQDVSVVICGGMGGGALNALEVAGVEVCAGVQGEADDVVEAYLRGELQTSEAGCGHHEEEGGCGGHCGSGCGGCHSRPAIEGKNVGRVCKTHYRGTFNDGTEFDSSYSRGEPLEFVCGMGQMIRGFDAAVANMDVGQVVDIHLMPEEAYGHADPRAIFTIPIAQLPGAEGVNVGEQVILYGEGGQPIQVKVSAKDETNITFDANHEMAGKELNFRIELVEVQ